jgi:hypothetical protein
LNRDETRAPHGCGRSGIVAFVDIPVRARRPTLSAQTAGLEAHPYQEQQLYFTDRGIEELEQRRGDEEITFEWLAEQLRTFVDLNPDFEVPVERLATWLARLDDEDEE